MNSMFLDSFVEIFLAETLDLLLLLFADLCWICYSVVLEIGIDKLFCNLSQEKSDSPKIPDVHPKRSTYLLGVALQIFFGKS